VLLHADLFVESMEESIDFYTKILGWKVVEDTIVSGPLVRHVSGSRHETMRLVMLKVSPIGAAVELLELRSDGGAAPAPIPHQGSLTILVKELDTLIDRLSARGFTPTSSTLEIETPQLGKHRIVFYSDPSGHALEFLEILKPGH
jgi:catechol 2,3-dioxygenase-like lactoylglutathione lyase family enzyme